MKQLMVDKEWLQCFGENFLLLWGLCFSQSVKSEFHNKSWIMIQVTPIFFNPKKASWCQSNELKKGKQHFNTLK